MWRFLTRTGEYALRAAIHIASREEVVRVSASEMARELGIPEKYLARVLAVLAREGVLESSRGVKGGFRLARPATEIRLADVVGPFEAVAEHPQCLTRPTRCNPAEPCGAHAHWSKATAGVTGFFRDTTLAAVAG